MNVENEQIKENWKRNIVLYLSCQIISLFGSHLVQFAIFWYVTLETQSGLMMTFFILCGFIPTFILSPFAGVWADRFNRKKLIMYSDGAIAVTTLILAIIFMTGYDAIWLIFLTAAIRAVGAGIQTPVVGAILPQIVPKEVLTKINGINSSLQAAIMFFVPIVSAALLTYVSIEMIFFVDVITAIIGIVTLAAFVKIPVHEKAAEKQSISYFGDFKEGLTYIKQHKFLKTFFLFLAVFFVLVAPAAFLTPLQVTRSFGAEVWKLTAVEIAFSLGMMIGGGIVASWGGFKNKIHTMTFANLFLGGCSFALGIAPNLWIYLFFMMICGIALPIFNTPINVLLQEKVDENYLGRIFGVYGMITTSMMPIGMLIFGPIADVIKIEWLLMGTGVVTILLTVFFGRNKLLLEAGKKVLKET